MDEILTILGSFRPFNVLDQGALLLVSEEIDYINLEKGELLFKQGDPGDSVYVLVRGRVCITVENPDGSVTPIDKLSSGIHLGEMAILTGGVRSATVRALENVQLIRLSKKGFELLLERYPDLFTQFYRTIIPRFQRTQLANILARLFGEVDTGTIHELQEKFEWIHLKGGSILFEQGEPADAMYIVVNGKLKASIHDKRGVVTRSGEICAGESVGEFALLTGEARSATVSAIRDSDIVRLSHSTFNDLLETYPQLMKTIMRITIKRYKRSIHNVAHQSMNAKTIAIIPANLEVPITEFSNNFVAALLQFGSVQHLNAERFDAAYGKPDAAKITENHPLDIALVAWLSKLEKSCQYVVYEADMNDTAWTRRCLRQADLILILAQSDSDPETGPVEKLIQHLGIQTRSELVLIHPANTRQPSGTKRWLDERRVVAHYHLRLHNAADIQRLVRCLTGNGLGLVLSGGGARGYAHWGVIRALKENGFVADLVGGTSMGALIGALHAMDKTEDEFTQLCQELSSPKKLFDPTLPVVSILNSKKVSEVCQKAYGDVLIEDLWYPFFCVSSNLTRASQVVHRKGLLWKAVRASIAIPGIFSPVLENGNVLVDGGVLNNLPVYEMQEFNQNGPIIAVDVQPKTDLDKIYNFDTSISGWRALSTKLFHAQNNLNVPSIFEILIRTIALNEVNRTDTKRELVDLYICPPTDDFGALEFHSYAKIIEIGYLEAQRAIKASSEKLGKTRLAKFRQTYQLINPNQAFDSLEDLINQSKN